MDKLTILGRGVLALVLKTVVVVVADIALLRTAALSVNGHTDMLLVAAIALALIAITVTLFGGVWIVRGVRVLIKNLETSS